MEISIKKLISYIILINLFFTSCVAPESARTSRSGSDTVTEGDRGADNGGNGAGPSDGNNVDSTQTLTSAKVEITQIVDPNTGTFRKKVSIPKDFEGYLYLSGLNISSLKENDKIISVKFYLGMERTPVVIPAVVGRVPGGLSPLSSIDVIILDIQDKPFRNIRLLYDLFDYNDYQEKGASPEEPTQDPTNAGLYCRGLLLEDDPTFEPLYSATEQAACDASPSTCVRDTSCDELGETCLYAYAKIEDSLLYQRQTIDSVEVKSRGTLTYEQYDVSGEGYSSDTSAQNLVKCLPDNNDASNLNGVLGSSSVTDVFSTFAGELDILVGGTAYKYDGPYRPLAESNWQISGNALLSPILTTSDTPKGLFQLSLGTPPFPGDGSESIASGGIYSFLFPRAGKLNYSEAGLQYYGSDNPFDTSRSLQVLPGAGETKWVDGCNLRIKNYDKYTNETISSCNVSATIEVISTVNGQEEVLVSTSDVKLQLLKSGLGESTGLEFSAMRSCDDSRSCGSGECCFNSRCWSRELVGQCGDDFTGVGNQGTGQSCQSDFECASLCCNQTKGVCSDHNSDTLEQVLCSKVPGQSCVSREFCRVENVRECYIIKTKDADGNDSCEKRCYNVPTYGDCVDGMCRQPPTPTEPPFDPTDPNRCQGALDSPPLNL